MAPSYTEMTAKMRERPTFAVAEKVLQQDYKLKLPSRTFIQLFSTPERPSCAPRRSTFRAT